MSAANPRPTGASWITPYIIVSNLDDILPFYEQAFCFETLNSVQGSDGSAWHAELRYQDQMLMMGKAGAYGGITQSPRYSGVDSPINLYLYCDDVDNFYQNAIDQGAKCLGAPEDMFWGDRMCRLQDPEGYIWCFATHFGDKAIAPK
jgi:PhnB protein